MDPDIHNTEGYRQKLEVEILEVLRKQAGLSSTRVNTNTEDVKEICSLHSEGLNADITKLQKIAHKYAYTTLFQLYKAVCEQYTQEQIFELLI